MKRLPFLLARFFGTPLRWLLGIFRSKVHGDVRWTSRLEMQRFLNPKHRGIVLSSKYRLSRAESREALVTK